MQTSDYLHVLFVSGSVTVIYTFSVTGHIRSNKTENIIKLGFNWLSFRTSFWCCFVFFVVMACMGISTIELQELKNEFRLFSDYKKLLRTEEI